MPTVSLCWIGFLGLRDIVSMVNLFRKGLRGEVRWLEIPNLSSEVQCSMGCKLMHYLQEGNTVVCKVVVESLNEPKLQYGRRHHWFF